MRNQIVYLDQNKTYRVYSDSSYSPFAIHYREKGKVGIENINVKFFYSGGKITFKGEGGWGAISISTDLISKMSIRV